MSMTDTTAPLLRPRAEETPRPATLSMLLSRASSRRGASMLVRETAARQLEERRADWGYSKPVVALDMLWNLLFVVASVAMLICAAKERPVVPLRVWICVYAAQCLVHVVLVWMEYRRRNTRRVVDTEANSHHSDESLDEDEEEREGASDAEISILPKYRFQICNDEDKPAVGAGRMVPNTTSSGDLASEHIVLPEDADCCICLSQYENGTELLSLPCNHHFHCACVVKWLKMNATCPLCKYNILKGSEQV